MDAGGIMLKIVKQIWELDFPGLMNVYIEGNLEKAKEYGANGLSRVEREFYDYLREDFFCHRGAFYAVWKMDGRAVSALRMEPYQDGWLLEALETAPEQRGRGYARALVTAALAYLGSAVVYSHVSKQNEPSLRTHLTCGFEKYLNHAVYIDGTVTQRAYTLRYESK